MGIILARAAREPRLFKVRRRDDEGARRIFRFPDTMCR